MECGPANETEDGNACFEIKFDFQEKALFSGLLHPARHPQRDHDVLFAMLVT
jgi:hypothetical protein